jgi:hypothetical protein
VASGEQTGRRRLPVELLVIGAACLVCCLPLLAGVFAGASGVVAGASANWLGAGPGLPLAVAVIVAALAASVGSRLQRRGPKCTTCGSTGCAC